MQKLPSCNCRKIKQPAGWGGERQVSHSVQPPTPMRASRSQEERERAPQTRPILGKIPPKVRRLYSQPVLSASSWISSDLKWEAPMPSAARLLEEDAAPRTQPRPLGAWTMRGRPAEGRTSSRRQLLRPHRKPAGRRRTGAQAEQVPPQLHPHQPARLLGSGGV